MFMRSTRRTITRTEMMQLVAMSMRIGILKKTKVSG
jgi:hypothetical protein